MPPELHPVVLAGEYALLPFAEIVGVAGELDHVAVGRMGQPNGDVLFRQRLGLVVLVLLVEEHQHLVGRVVGHRRLEQLGPAIGKVGKLPRHDQPGGDPLAAVSHLDLDGDQLFAGQLLLGAFQHLALGVAELVVDVVLGHHRRPRLGLRLDHQAAVLALDDAGLFQGHGPQPLAVGIANQPALALGGVEDFLGCLTEFREHGSRSPVCEGWSLSIIRPDRGASPPRTPVV